MIAMKPSDTGVQIRPLEKDDLGVVTSWLGDPKNYKWLDFGHGVQALNAMNLKLMMGRDLHLLRVYSVGEPPRPIGIIGLSDVCHLFSTATLWYVLGNKAFKSRGLTSRAVSKLLTEGFRDLGLHSVKAWTVTDNFASIRVLERNNFTCTGKQRSCHILEDKRYDRLLYDLLATEHRELENAERGTRPDQAERGDQSLSSGSQPVTKIVESERS